MSHGPFGLIAGREVGGGDLECGLRLGRDRLAYYSFGRGQLVQARDDQLGRRPGACFPEFGPLSRLAGGRGVWLGGRVSAYAWPGDRSGGPVSPCCCRWCRRHGCWVAPGR